MRLRRCPFCGGKAQADTEGFTMWPHFVKCVTCGCRTMGFRLKTLAVSAWNKRKS